MTQREERFSVDLYDDVLHHEWYYTVVPEAMTGHTGNQSKVFHGSFIMVTIINKGTPEVVLY